MNHKPLGKTDKLKKGEQTLICRGIKYEGRNTLLLEDDRTAPIRTLVRPFKYLSDAELTTLNITAKTKAQLLHEIRKEHPDFQEHELITIIFIDIENAVGEPKGKDK